MAITPIRSDSGSRIIGIYDDASNVFAKVVSKSKHWYRAAGAWCIDVGAISSLPDDSIIEIRDAESGDVFTTTTKAVKNSCRIVDLKFGKQYVITEKFFDIRRG